MDFEVYGHHENATEEGKRNARKRAVSVALQLIQAQCSSGAGDNLEHHMGNLSKYADIIQEAAKFKQ